MNNWYIEDEDEGCEFADEDDVFYFDPDDYRQVDSDDDEMPSNVFGNYLEQFDDDDN